MNKPDTIDEILHDTIPGGVDGPNWEKADLAKAALSAMVAEIIGEDGKCYCDPTSYTRCSNCIENEVLAEQRQRAIAKGFTL